MSLKKAFSLILIFIFLTGCTANAAIPEQPAATQAATVTLAVETQNPTDSPVETQSDETLIVTREPTSEPTDGSQNWLEMPIIPELSPEMLEVYQRGLVNKRDPHRFSKIGDCQNINTYFLNMFDGGTYSLGEEYANLQATIDYFAGSWSRKSLAVKGGLNIMSVQSTMWTPAVETYTKKEGTCKKGETPLVCELRDFSPSFAIISMEESWDGSLQQYDDNMRQIVEYVISQDVVPILATRSELLSQERQINDMVVKIAEDYHLPLWNFGAAASKLPNAGLREDGFHLTPYDEENYPHADFMDPVTMQFGWTWRNLTALQTMDAMRKAVENQ